MIGFIFTIDEEAHREECRKHAWLLREAHEQLAYERNLVGVLSRRLDERDGDYHRLAALHRAQAETIGSLQRDIAELEHHHAIKRGIFA